jgi:hypothetical protein
MPFVVHYSDYCCAELIGVYHLKSEAIENLLCHYVMNGYLDDNLDMKEKILHNKCTFNIDLLKKLHDKNERYEYENKFIISPFETGWRYGIEELPVTLNEKNYYKKLQNDSDELKYKPGGEEFKKLQSSFTGNNRSTKKRRKSYHKNKTIKEKIEEYYDKEEKKRLEFLETLKTMDKLKKQLKELKDKEKQLKELRDKEKNQ